MKTELAAFFLIKKKKENGCFSLQFFTLFFGAWRLMTWRRYFTHSVGYSWQICRSENITRQRNKRAYMKLQASLINQCIIYCISHTLQHCKSTHPISMADCTYLALTWVLKHFLCNRKRAWICHIFLQAVTEHFEAMSSCLLLFLRCTLKPTVKFILFSHLSGRCLKKLPVQPSGVFNYEF